MAPHAGQGASECADGVCTKAALLCGADRHGLDSPRHSLPRRVLGAVAKAAFARVQGGARPAALRLDAHAQPRLLAGRRLGVLVHLESNRGRLDDGAFGHAHFPVPEGQTGKTG